MKSIELILEDLRKILNEKRNENNDAKNDDEIDSHGYNYFCGKVDMIDEVINYLGSVLPNIHK